MTLLFLALVRNGRTTRRPAGPDDGQGLSSQGADTHWKQVKLDAAAMFGLIFFCFQFVW